jgi:cytochrome c-type biogenesis protein CcmH/NrfG
MKKALIISLVLLTAFIAACEQKANTPIPQGAAPALNIDNEVRFLKGVLREDPKNLGAWTKLGHTYMDAEHYVEAVDAYGKVLELDPTNVNVIVDRGTCYRRIGRPDKAAEHFRKGLALDPKHIYANKNLGVVLAFDFGDSKGGAEQFEKYLELSPNAPDAVQIKGIIRDLKAAASAQPATTTP